MGVRSNGRSSPSRLGAPKNGANKEESWDSVEEQAGLSPKLHGSPSSAADALERIKSAQDVHDRIAERLWTGASLIISDQPVRGETGPVGTDLTVKVR